MIQTITSLTHNGRGRERHLSYFVKPPIQPASCRNSSLSATLAGRVNFAALLLCLVFVIVSHSHAPSAAFRLVLGSCVMRVPTRQSITSAKDLCIVRSVDSTHFRLKISFPQNVGRFQTQNVVRPENLLLEFSAKSEHFSEKSPLRLQKTQDFD